MASQEAVKETRRQREIDNARAELALLGRVYDDAAAFMQALSTQLRQDPAKVETLRGVLRRSILVAGVATPSLLRLATSNGPLTPSDADSVISDLNDRSAALHSIIADVGFTNQPAPASLSSNAQ
jgi:hypothetical protein